MKYKIALICLLFSVMIQQAYSQNKGYRIELNNLQIKDKPNLYLGTYINGGVYAVDSILVTQSKVVLQSENKLPQGQYFIVVKPYFRIELLIGDDIQNIVIDLNPKQLADSKIIGSKDTDLLWKYLRYQTLYKAKRNELDERKKQSGLSDQDIKKIEEEQEALDKEVWMNAEKLVLEHQNEWFGKYLKANIPVASVIENPLTPEDRITNRRYLKTHFFDNIDLKDSRFWKTEVLTSAINTYMTQLVGNNPDSLANAASWLVSKTVDNDIAFKNMLSYFVNESLNSNIVGDENTWARLYVDYIQNKNLSWISTEQREMLRSKYEQIRYNRLGVKAQNLTLGTIDGEIINTNEIEASTTLLYFYDPDCESCKTYVPELYNDVFLKYKDKGFRVIAINVGVDQQQWKDFVKEHKLSDWINVSDPEYKSEYMKYYDIPSTPTMFFLNNEKKIVMKSMGADDLKKILEHYYTLRNGTN